MLTRPNVDLVTGPIAEVTEDAIVTRDGVTHPTDIIILGTGFTASTGSSLSAHIS